jgi:hypothetical protein
MYYEEIPPILELQANLDYVKERAKAIGDLLDVLHNFKPNIEKYGLSPVRYHGFVDHLSEELLGSETEKEILENDIAKEKFLATPFVAPGVSNEQGK